jgi:hypothetical protein
MGYYRDPSAFAAAAEVTLEESAFTRHPAISAGATETEGCAGSAVMY